MAKTLRIFVLADTHDRFPEKLSSLAKDADEIWHLGDVCAESILDALSVMGAPVSVVRGNCDENYEWPLILNLERNGVRFQLVHIPPSQSPPGIDVVLHGHTHVPRDEMKSGVRFLNPGCVTRPNRGAPSSVATLEIKPDGKLRWSLTNLR